MNDKRKFVKPEAEIFEFKNEDIITESLGLADTAGWTDGSENY